MLKIALLGNEIPFYFPNILADAVYAHRIPCQISFYQENNEVGELLLNYGKAVAQGSSVEVTRAFSPLAALQEAQGVIYANDNKSTSYYHNDIQFLAQVDPDRRFLGNRSPYSGIEGLLQSLRQGTESIPLGKLIKEHNPDAKIILLSPNATALVQLFGHLGLDAVAFYPDVLEFNRKMAFETGKSLGTNPEQIHFTYGGLEHFTWLTAMDIGEQPVNLLQLKQLFTIGYQEDVAIKWVDTYDAIAFGDSQKIGQFLPVQPGIFSMDEVLFTETVAQRKERILLMSSIAQNGLEQEEGRKNQSKLLSTVSNLRPVEALYTWLGKEEKKIQGVLQLNRNKQVSNLPIDAVIVDELQAFYTKGKGKTLPPAIEDLAYTICHWQKTVAKATLGDWAMVREAVEEDLALEGGDRLAAFTLVQEFIEQYRQILPQFFME